MGIYQGVVKHVRTCHNVVSTAINLRLRTTLFNSVLSGEVKSKKLHRKKNQNKNQKKKSEKLNARFEYLKRNASLIVSMESYQISSLR